MERTPTSGEAKQQTTGRVLVVWIILDNPGIHACLTYFVIADVSLNSASESVVAELKLTAG